MQYPSLEEAMTFPYSPIGDGESMHSVIKVDWNGRNLVYKEKKNSKALRTVKSSIKALLKKVDKPIQSYFYTRVPILSVRVDDDRDNTFGIESKILSEWKKRGIPCTDLLEQHDDAMVYDYVKSVSYHELLQRPGYHPEEFAKLLEVIAQIRAAAFKESDKSLLHPDLYTRNFLYVQETGKALAIDPGLKIRDDLSVEHTDAVLNLFFIHYFCPTPHKDLYVKEFLSSLDKNTKERMKELNHDMDRFTRAYFSIRSAALGIMRGRPQPRYLGNYDRENLEHISSLLESA